MRGERCHIQPESRRRIGSSPHARGTRRTSGNWMTCTTVHPRMRGERGLDQPGGFPLGGSSPHARGTLAKFAGAYCRSRFIPACAGNARSRQKACCPAPVHPRMRGERFRSSCVWFVLGGSSPHARGTQPLTNEANHENRFIPACAGNATGSRWHSGCTAVHPRMRGERMATCIGSCRKFGSSPHARGTLPDVFVNFECERFIPACAGNAWMSR